MIPASADLGRYRGVVLDLDGVVVLGDQAIIGAPEAVSRIRTAGCGVVFATNNASRTAGEVAALLRGAGIPAEDGEVVTSAMAAAELLGAGTRCLVIGMEGLRWALARRGMVEVREPAEAEAVVVGLDREVTYDDLRRATLALRAGARFVATNLDPTLPTPEGLWPGAGSLVAALVTASERRPEVAGKPHAPLFHAAAEHLPAGPLLMVGDRHDTDIAGAAALGWNTALVLSGVTSAEQAANADPAPDYLSPSLATLIP